MIPNIHQSIDEIIRAASPAEKILWQHIRLITGERAAIRQLHYQGVIAASDFATYQSGKLFLASKIQVGSPTTTSAGNFSLGISNESDVVLTYLLNYPFYDTSVPQARFTGNIIKLENLYFSRLVPNLYTNLIFTGYKISY